MVLCGSALGQATRPADAPATRPAADAKSARVQKVEGKVSYSLANADGTFGEWVPVKEGDQLGGGTRIRTGLRSRLILIFGDNTVVMIERATLASIDQFRGSGESQQIALGLGHGAVRAGTAETTLRSDMVIQTPTATLSKRGTFEMVFEYEASTGQFRASLSEQGLISILSRLTGMERTVAPGQHVTDAMTRWIDMAKISGWVPVQDQFGLTQNEMNFNMLFNTGQGVFQAGGGNMSNVNANWQPGELSGAVLQGRLSTMAPALIGAGGTPRVNRPEGNFGARR